MNILFLSTRSPYPLISGHSLRTYHILKGAAQNHNVTLVTFVQLPEHELDRDNLDHLRSMCQAVYPFRIPIDLSRGRLASSLLLNLFSLRPFVAQKYDVLKPRKKIKEIISTQRIDLVHVDMLPLTVYLNEFNQLPKLLVNHNVESLRLYRWFRSEPNPLRKMYLGIQWLKLRSFERSAMGKFDACVVVSETDKQLLKNMRIKNRLFVVPNGTDTTFFKPSTSKIIKNSVLWIGHMDVHTNRDAVLYLWREIYPILRQRLPQVRIIFVGTAPPKEIEAAANENARVKVTGFVDDIRPYVEKAQVIVVPIRIGSGTRLKILDAMAMGKAIVSTSVGCEGLNVIDGQNILIADNPHNFANRIEDLLNDQVMRKRIERKARDLAETYDWCTVTKEQERVYRYIMKEVNI